MMLEDSLVNRRKTAHLLPVAAWIAVASAVSPVAAARTITLEIAPRIIGGQLRIEGATDLPDYAMLDWGLRHARRHELMNRVPFENMTNEGRMMVRDGRFSTTIDMAGWPEGIIEVWVGFHPVAFGARQPRHITRLFGEYGRQLEGPNIERVGEYRNMLRAVAVAHVVLERGRAGKRRAGR
jgi:hypothetical protein